MILLILSIDTYYNFLFFFFSSRRRHTRFDCDWSSDVCSSDLQAFQRVKKEVEKVIAGENPAALSRAVHNDWYRELFQPSVTAGLIEAGSLAGYRNIPVYLRGSRYVPPRWEAVRDAMPAFFDLLEKEPEPSVRAVLGHWLFGYV